MEKEVLQVAILIDGDNISSKYAKCIKQEAAQYGNIKVCRLYGAVNCPNVKSWYKVMPEQGIVPMLQICYCNGKSVADQALTIDGMDLLYTGDIDVFCLISSDCDFTKLVYRMKEAGKTVIGMGEQKTKEALAKACDEFKILDLIFKAEHSQEKLEEEPMPEETEEAEAEALEELPEETLISVPEEAEIIDEVLDVLDTMFADYDKVNLAKIGSELSKRRPGFDPRNYNYRNMNQFISAHGDVLTVKKEKAPDGIHNIVYVSRSSEQQEKGRRLTAETAEAASEELAGEAYGEMSEAAAMVMSEAELSEHTQIAQTDEGEETGGTQKRRASRKRSSGKNSSQHKTGRSNSGKSSGGANKGTHKSSKGKSGGSGRSMTGYAGVGKAVPIKTRGSQK